MVPDMSTPEKPTTGVGAMVVMSNQSKTGQATPGETLNNLQPGSTYQTPSRRYPPHAVGSARRVIDENIEVVKRQHKEVVNSGGSLTRDDLWGLRLWQCAQAYFSRPKHSKRKPHVYLEQNMPDSFSWNQWVDFSNKHGLYPPIPIKGSRLWAKMMGNGGTVVRK